MATDAERIELDTLILAQDLARAERTSAYNDRSHLARLWNEAKGDYEVTCLLYEQAEEAVDKHLANRSSNVYSAPFEPVILKE